MEGKSLKINLRLVGYILYGIVSSCVFGLGLSMAILSEEKMILVIIGMIGIVLAYPLYSMITEKQKEKLAPKILELTKELMK